MSLNPETNPVTSLLNLNTRLFNATFGLSSTVDGRKIEELRAALPPNLV